MSEIMTKPKWIDNPSTYGPHPRTTFYDGQQILNKFYNQSIGYGSLTEDNIPQELKEKNWKPDKDKTYKCWWYWTNPADTSVLLYIEEVGINDKISMIVEYTDKIISMLSKLSLQQLKEIFELSKLSLQQLKEIFEHIKKRYYV